MYYREEFLDLFVVVMLAYKVNNGWRTRHAARMSPLDWLVDLFLRSCERQASSKVTSWVVLSGLWRYGINKYEHIYSRLYKILSLQFPTNTK